MKVINIKDALARCWLNLSQSLPRYEPFAELAARPHTEIVIDGNGYSLYRASRANVPVLPRRVVHVAPDAASVCALLRKGEEVVVAVDLERCYRRHVSLPREAEGKIGQILDLDMARVTPFARADVFAGWINHRGKESATNLNVEQIIIRKDIVAGLHEAIHHRGARAIGLIVRNGQAPALPLALSLEGGFYGAAAAKRSMQMAAVSLVVLSAGLVAFGSAALTRQSHILSVIAEQSAEAAIEAADVRARLEQLKSNSAEISALQARRSRDRLVSAVEELSRILPDSAFLDGLSIETSKVVVDGGAAAPEELISPLEATSLFKNVSFSSPVFKNPNEPQSHFSIKLELQTPTGGGQN